MTSAWYTPKSLFSGLINQGMITSYAYQRKNKTLVPIDEVRRLSDTKFEENRLRRKAYQSYAKMSKSLKNVITPMT
ncbi:hypothetical protein [Treponema phagedenis]|uniref:hypothetical protein n=1 Tax=Treponema phagedenis TaxID=162 RepID=UPI0021CCEA01|nr:hypothetical protein [Treponema phagedenis]